MLGSTTVFTLLDVIIGSVTFSGSIIAAGKLQGLIPGQPIIFKGGRLLNVALAVVAIGTAAFMLTTASLPALLIVVLAALAFGVMMVLPIGGADMPVVISLLNAFTGTAVAMAGFVIGNWALIVAGALVGASGGILTKLMADAMNRSLANIIVGGFGTGDSAVAIGGPVDAQVRAIAADDAAIQLAYASKVIIVPGLRPGRRAGPARRGRAGQDPGGPRHRGQLRHPPGGGPDARPHERAAGRGERALSAAQGDGRDQPGVRRAPTWPWSSGPTT